MTLDATIPDAVTFATTVVINVAPLAHCRHQSHLLGVDLGIAVTTVARTLLDYSATTSQARLAQARATTLRRFPAIDLLALFKSQGAARTGNCRRLSVLAKKNGSVLRRPVETTLGYREELVGIRAAYQVMPAGRLGSGYR